MFLFALISAQTRQRYFSRLVLNLRSIERFVGCERIIDHNT